MDPIGAVAIGVFLLGLIALGVWLRHREREGHWDKEGHGSPEHTESGVHYRPLETPPREPFD